jgi:hypothetical protein
MSKCHQCDNEGEYEDDEYIEGETVYFCFDCFAKVYNYGFDDNHVDMYVTTDNGIPARMRVDPNIDDETLNALKRMIDAAAKYIEEQGE